MDTDLLKLQQLKKNILIKDIDSFFYLLSTWITYILNTIKFQKKILFTPHKIWLHWQFL